MKTVRTENATNASMQSITERLGFKLLRESREAQINLILQEQGK